MSDDQYWDKYVRDWTSEEFDWPGDEWCDDETWLQMQFDRLVRRAGVESWKRAVEIGPGSGKHALLVLGTSEVELRAFDVSPEFLSVCADRCRNEIAAGRLSLHQISVQDPASALDRLQDWRRTVDGFYSLEAMVHVDLQYLIVYLITAALVLRPGGKLVMNVATATNEQGFELLLSDIKRYWPVQLEPSGKFEWLSRELVERVLARLGFQFDFISEDRRRDVEFIASLAHPDVADRFEAYLR
jgi:SAM-dependent methyltransferase